MAKYREHLPQMSDKLFLTDGGLETTLIFHKGFDLPEFAAFTLLRDKKGREAMVEYFQAYAEIAAKNKLGFVLEGMTWRASSAWGEKLGYAEADLAAANRDAMEFLESIRNKYESAQSPMVISGCMGPRGDGYSAVEKMSVAEAEAYHLPQIKALAAGEADMVSAYTMNYTEEAIGVCRAAQKVGIPAVISFTVETDGKLPSGEPLGEAIETVDRETDSYPAYYMINCAHPTHLEKALVDGAAWLERIHGVRANASSKSHEELDECDVLDDGNPHELGLQCRALRDKLPRLNVLGGCCGTDERHVAEICKACLN